MLEVIIILVGIARAIVAVIGLVSVGGVVADAVIEPLAGRHMRNPHWRPHAKFHNGQGIIMGVLLSCLTEWLVFGRSGRGFDGLATAAAAASIFWLSMALAILFPGTAWEDPEFSGGRGRGRPTPLVAAAACLAGLVIAIALAAIGDGA